MQRLLADITSRRLDVIVVYKVDRLTRSLADFARLVEVFDAAGVSFVSVTQQFNTTTSMGRLTLNVLLSFAQFEREVTGERIRDKIAASKRKGLWMGGVPMLGYRPNGRTLEIEPNEAETVRTLFTLYAELGSVPLLKTEADRRGIVSKRWTTPQGRTSGGVSMSRGALYYLLSNPIYIGRIMHKGESHPGQHAPIIDQMLWDQVQAQLATKPRDRRPRVTGQSMLVGKLYDADGNRMTPSHAQKGGKRYRYYVSVKAEGDRSSGWRLPAQEIEGIVVRTLLRAFEAPHELVAQLQGGRPDVAALDRSVGVAAIFRAVLVGREPDVASALVRGLIGRVTIDLEKVVLQLDANLLSARFGLAQAAIDQESPFLLTAAIEIRRRGVEMRLTIPDERPRLPSRHDPALIKAVARGHAWFAELASGVVSSIAAIASREGITARYVSRLLPLAFLDPSTVEAILDGRQPTELTAEALTRCSDLDDELCRSATVA